MPATPNPPIGGGLAPYVAGRIAEATNLAVPFWIGGATFLAAIGVLALGHGMIREADQVWSWRPNPSST